MAYVPNPAFEQALLRSLGVKTKLELLARRGAELYAASVPVDTGALRDSIFGDVALGPDGYRGRIGARDWKAGLVELGDHLHKPDGSLRRAVESLGVHVEIQGAK